MKDLKLALLPTSRQEKEAWIHAKYVEKKFLTKLPEIRGRRGGRGPPRGHPPVPPKPSIRPQPGIIRSKSGRDCSAHGRLLDTVADTEIIPWRKSEGPDCSFREIQ